MDYYDQTGNYNSNISFQNSYLGNWSLIRSDDWSYYLNGTFYNNTYLAGTQNYTCFDYPANLTCEGPFPIISLPSSSTPTSNKILPVYGISSMILTYIMLIGYFIFN